MVFPPWLFDNLDRFTLSFVRCSSGRSNEIEQTDLLRDVLLDGEFDPGSERTLAAWFRHASRARYLN